MDDGFDWDPAKARENLKKHQFSFEEAQSAFRDPFRITIYDERHSQDEDRFLLLAQTSRARLVVVAFAERESTIRIISVRRATKSERQAYERLDSR
jgi:uncharacterized protein